MVFAHPGPCRRRLSAHWEISWTGGRAASPGISAMLTNLEFSLQPWLGAGAEASLGIGTTIPGTIFLSLGWPDLNWVARVLTNFDQSLLDYLLLVAGFTWTCTYCPIYFWLLGWPELVAGYSYLIFGRWAGLNRSPGYGYPCEVVPRSVLVGGVGPWAILIELHWRRGGG